MNIVEEKTVDPMRIHDCVEDVLRAQLKEDKEDGIRKRKTSVIIHGLPEPTASIAENRIQEDNEQIEELLHKLESDEVTVNKIICLGKRSTESDAKPRPVKLELASEEQKDKLLKQTKKTGRNTRREHWRMCSYTRISHQIREKTARTCEAIKRASVKWRKKLDDCKLEDNNSAAQQSTTRDNSGLKCLYTNANSLMNKRDEFFYENCWI